MRNSFVTILVGLNVVVGLISVWAFASALDPSASAVSHSIMKTVEEPVLTWTFFISVLGFPSILLLIKHLLGQIKDTIIKRDEAVDKATREWQNGARERHEDLKSRFDKFESCMEGVKKSVAGKVDSTECDRLCEEKWERIHHHSHEAECIKEGCKIKVGSVVVK